MNSTTCSLTLVGPADNGKFRHRCLLCGREHVSKYADPAMIKRECRVKAREAVRQELLRPTWGPGTELHDLLESLGAKPKQTCACEARRQEMDRWGVDGCRERRELILKWLREAYDESTWGEVFWAGFLSLVTGAPKSLEGLLDEAIRRAEVKAATREQDLLAELKGPPQQHDPLWNARPEIQAAHQTLLDEAVATEWPPLSGHGRGIVTLAGGKYFASGYVLVSILRKLHCPLPIEWWYLPGEMGGTEIALVEALGVECVRLTDRCQPRRLGGWEAKAHAILHSRFAEVLFLDADQVPIRDPAYLFEDERYQATGAVFWQDNPPYGFTLTEEAFRIARLPVPAKVWPEWKRPSNYDAWETGQMLIDKRRHSQALHIAREMADHSEFWFPVEHRGNEAFTRFMYGDKDTFFLAWHRVGSGYVTPPLPVYVGDKRKAGMFLQPDLDGQPLFQHRVHPGYKWSLERENARVPSFVHHDECLAALADLRKWYGRKAWFSNSGMRVLTLSADGQTGQDGLTWKPEGDLLRLGDQLLGRDDHGNWVNHGTHNFLMDAPPEGFAIPYERAELAIYNDILRDNEYRLPERLAETDVILDIGGHCGIFATACLERGAGLVISVEPHPTNFDRLTRNLARYGERSQRIQAAASDRDGEVLLAIPGGAEHTGGWTCVNVQQGLRAEAVPFNRLVSEPIRLVKLDCEGSEWAILESCRCFDHIQAWCGEYHLLPHVEAEAKLRALLEPHGYVVTVEPHPKSTTLGHFWAEKSERKNVAQSLQ